MSLTDRLKDSWNDFRASKPGERFRDRYRRRRTQSDGPYGAKRVLYVLIGLLIVAAGLFLVPAPGPGWAIVFFGVSLLGSEILLVARLMDHAEMKGRAVTRWSLRSWRRASLTLRILIGLLLVASLAGLSYGTYRIFFGLLVPL